MWIRLSEWIQRVSNNWVALSALVIFLLFTALVLPGQASRAAMDNAGVGSPDLSFYYTAEDLYQMAAAYSAAGRRAYVEARFTFDLVWPFVYASFLTVGISWLSRRAFRLDSLWQRSNLVPVWAALFDILENSSTSLVMIRYPDGSPVVDVLASVFTMLKWVFVSGSFVLLLAGMMVGVWGWLRRRSKG